MSDIDHETNVVSIIIVVALIFGLLLTLLK